MATQLSSPEGGLFTFDQILYFARLLQQIQGAEFQYVGGDSEGVEGRPFSLPDNMKLVQAFQSLHGDRSGAGFHLLVVGIDICITKYAEIGDEKTGRAFAIDLKLLDERRIDNTGFQNSEGNRETKEYHVFDDYLTSFVWASYNEGSREELLDDDMEKVFTPGLANDLRTWTNKYDTNFRMQGCDQGSGQDVFTSLQEIIVWTLEGAILAARMAAVTGVAVLYSAYLRHGSKYRFVGKATLDMATLMDLVSKLNKQLTTLRPSGGQPEGILRLMNY